MAAWRYRDTDTVGIFRDILCVGRCLILGFVEFEADLGELVELRDSAAFDFRWDAAL